jgi:hypothetical protein
MEEVVMPLHGWRGVARYGLPGMLVGMMAAGGIGGDRGAQVRAQAENLPGMDRSRMTTSTSNDGSGTIAFASPAGSAAQFLYIIDSRTRAVAIYRVDPNNPKGTLKLEAARQYQWDLKLSEYNNNDPHVADVESSIKLLQKTR